MYLAVEGGADPKRVREVVNATGLFRETWDYAGAGPYSLGENDEDPILAYWRKANAIHGWFVRELADGVDDCQKIPVTIPQMQDLVDRCKKVLGAGSDIQDTAEEVGLMPTPGFFFGGTEMDEWYVQDLRETIEQLEKILSAKGLGEASYYYEASW